MSDEENVKPVNVDPRWCVLEVTLRRWRELPPGKPKVVESPPTVDLGSITAKGHGGLPQELFEHIMNMLQDNRSYHPNAPRITHGLKWTNTKRVCCGNEMFKRHAGCETVTYWRQ